MVLLSRGMPSENFVRWELPLSRGMAYYHAARLLDGQGMRWPEAGAEEADWFEGKVRKIRGRGR